MENILNNKRIFKYEKEETRYLIFEKEEIKEYQYFYNDIAIKKGDLLFPNRWLRFDSNTLIPIESFRFLIMNIFFYLQKSRAKGYNKVFFRFQYRRRFF